MPLYIASRETVNAEGPRAQMSENDQSKVGIKPYGLLQYLCN
jgi:hypothetical protein